MLTIRLARTGKKHQAYFRITVADSKKTPTAKFIEILGNYDPHTKKFVINEERLSFYLKNGAQPSNSIAKLLAREKINLPKWVKIVKKKRIAKKEEAKLASENKNLTPETDKTESNKSEAEKEAVSDEPIKGDKVSTEDKDKGKVIKETAEN